MAHSAHLDQIVMALSCLLSATEFNQTPISLNSQLIYEVDNDHHWDCQFEAINEIFGLEEKIKELAQLQAKHIDNLEHDIEEMRKYISHVVAEQNNNKDQYCEGIENGVATIRINSTSVPLEITCVSNRYGKNWMLVLNKTEKSKLPGNSKTYIDGYKNANGNYFIGLETLRALSLERKHEALMVWEDEQNMEHFVYVPSASIGTDYKILLTLNNLNSTLFKSGIKVIDKRFSGHTMKIFIKAIAELDN